MIQLIHVFGGYLPSHVKSIEGTHTRVSMTKPKEKVREEAGLGQYDSVFNNEVYFVGEVEYNGRMVNKYVYYEDHSWFGSFMTEV